MDFARAAGARQAPNRREGRARQRLSKRVGATCASSAWTTKESCSPTCAGATALMCPRRVPEEAAGHRRQVPRVHAAAPRRMSACAHGRALGAAGLNIRSQAVRCVVGNCDCLLLAIAGDTGRQKLLLKLSLSSISSSAGVSKSLLICSLLS